MVITKSMSTTFDHINNIATGIRVYLYLPMTLILQSLILILKRSPKTLFQRFSSLSQSLQYLKITVLIVIRFVLLTPTVINLPNLVALKVVRKRCGHGVQGQKQAMESRIACTRFLVQNLQVQVNSFLCFFLSLPLQSNALRLTPRR